MFTILVKDLSTFLSVKEALRGYDVQFENVTYSVDTDILTVNNFTLNFETQILTINEINSFSQKIIQLTPKEFKLLKILMTNAGHIVTREFLMKIIWGNKSTQLKERIIDIYMGYLRKKLGDYANVLTTNRGIGCMFKKQ